MIDSLPIVCATTHNGDDLNKKTLISSCYDGCISNCSDNNFYLIMKTRKNFDVSKNNF